MIKEIKNLMNKNKEIYNKLITKGWGKNYIDHELKNNLHYAISDYELIDLENKTEEQLELIYDNLFNDFDDLNVIEALFLVPIITEEN